MPRKASRCCTKTAEWHVAVEHLCQERPHGNRCRRQRPPDSRQHQLSGDPPHRRQPVPDHGRISGPSENHRLRIPGKSLHGSPVSRMAGVALHASSGNPPDHAADGCIEKRMGSMLSLRLTSSMTHKKTAADYRKSVAVFFIPYPAGYQNMYARDTCQVFFFILISGPS